MANVSVIIVNYNTKEVTAACIDSIFEYTKEVDVEVILSDNASTDGSKDLFRRDDRITYIYNNDNYGFGKANNIGASKANGKYLFFLNSDTYLQNDAISIFFRYAESHTDKGNAFIGTHLHDTDGNANGSGGHFPTLWNSLKQAAHLLHQEEVRPEEPFDPYKVDYVLGADVFVSREVFEKLQGFDEEFFMYYEESDLMRRGRENGYGCKIICGPQIVHLEGKSTGRVSHRKRMMVEKSHMLHLKKHYARWKYKLFLTAYILLKLSSFVNGHFSYRENKEYIKMLIQS